MKSIYSTRTQSGNSIYTTRHFNDKVMKLKTLISNNGREINVDNLISDANFKDTITQMGNTVNRHTSEISVINNRVVELESAKNSHETLINNNTVDISDNKQAIDILVGNMKEVTASIEDHEQNINNALENINSNLDLIQNLETNVNTNTNNIANLTTRVSNNETNHSNLETNVNTNTNNITNLTTRIETLENTDSTCDCDIPGTEITVQPFKGLTDEILQKMNVSMGEFDSFRNQEVQRTVNTGIQEGIMGAHLANAKIVHLVEPRITTLETDVENLKNNGTSSGTGNCDCTDTLTNLTTRIETLENTDSTCDCDIPGTEITIQPFKGLTDEILQKMNVSMSEFDTFRNQEVQRTVNTGIQEGIMRANLAVAKITHLVEPRLTTLENNGTSSGTGNCNCSDTLTDLTTRIETLENTDSTCDCDIPGTEITIQPFKGLTDEILQKMNVSMSEFENYRNTERTTTVQNSVQMAVGQSNLAVAKITHLVEPRITTLETNVGTNTNNITDLTSRIETLENNSGTGCNCVDTITDLTSRVETLENNGSGTCNCGDTITDLTSRVETLENNSGSSGSGTGCNCADTLTDLTTRVETLESRMTTLAQQILAIKTKIGM